MRTFAVVISAILALSQCLFGCDRQRIHLNADQMYERAVTADPITLRGAVRAEGYLKLFVVVDQAGKPSCISAISGHPMLLAAAIEGVKDWRFEQYRRKAKPIKYSGEVVLNVKDSVISLSRKPVSP